MVEERSCFGMRLRRAMGEATLRDIRKNFESRISRGEFVRVREASDDPLRRSFTTARMLAFEQDNIATMRAGQDLQSPLVRSAAMRQFEAELAALSDSQRKAVREVLESHDRITGLSGRSGQREDDHPPGYSRSRRTRRVCRRGFRAHIASGPPAGAKPELTPRLCKDSCVKAKPLTRKASPLRSGRIQSRQHPAGE